MRFLSLVGLYQKSPSTAASLASGVYWNTAPTDCPPLRSLAVEDGNIYEFCRITGTCTVGSLLYRMTGTMAYGTGNTGPNVGCAYTGVMPAGVSMVAPTVSGAWSWMQVYGKNTTVQVTNTFGGGFTSGLSAAMYGGWGSAALNLSAYITGFMSSTAGLSSIAFYIGQSLTDATGSTTVGFINLL